MLAAISGLVGIKLLSVKGGEAYPLNPLEKMPKNEPKSCVKNRVKMLILGCFWAMVVC